MLEEPEDLKRKRNSGGENTAWLEGRGGGSCLMGLPQRSLQERDKRSPETSTPPFGVFRERVASAGMTGIYLNPGNCADLRALHSLSAAPSGRPVDVF